MLMAYVRAEGHYGQSVGASDVSGHERTIAILHFLRRCHLLGNYIDAEVVFLNHGLRGIELAVVTGYLKAADVVHTRESVVCMFEEDAHRVVRYRAVVVSRIVGVDVLQAISIVQCHVSQSVAHLPLLVRMNLPRLEWFYEVIDTYTPGILYVTSDTVLSVTEQWGTVIRAVACLRRYL